MLERYVGNVGGVLKNAVMQLIGKSKMGAELLVGCLARLCESFLKV